MKFFDRFWKKQTLTETKEERCVHVFARSKTVVKDLIGDFYLAKQDHYDFDIKSSKITKTGAKVKRCIKCGLYSAVPSSRKVFDGKKWHNDSQIMGTWLIDRRGKRYLIHCNDVTGELILVKV